MCLGVPGRVVAIDGEGVTRVATVDFGGAARTVSVALVPGLAIGDFALVHAGVAIAVVDEDQARVALELLATLGDPPAEAEVTPPGEPGSVGPTGR